MQLTLILGTERVLYKWNHCLSIEMKFQWFYVCARGRDFFRGTVGCCYVLSNKKNYTTSTAIYFSKLIWIFTELLTQYGHCQELKFEINNNPESITGITELRKKKCSERKRERKYRKKQRESSRFTSWISPPSSPQSAYIS